MTLMAEETGSGAIFSPDGLYRYELSRWWNIGPRALVCMANPSNASASKNDPTISSLSKLIRALGYPGFTVVNWCPLINSNPELMYARWRSMYQNERAVWEKIVAANNLHIERAASHAPIRIMAWGNITPCMSNSKPFVKLLTAGNKYPLWAFGLNTGGGPKHPLARGQHRIRAGRDLVRYDELAIVPIEPDKDGLFLSSKHPVKVDMRKQPREL